jgi:hypothetical protein
MSFWLRIALTWLLALALPLQGHAAQSMRLCGPEHGGSAGFADLAPPSSAADHVHADAAAHSHAHPDAELTTADIAGTAGGADPHTSSQHGKCSVCAACCGAFALTGAVRLFEASPAPAHYSADVPTPSPGTIPGGLERPPRHPLA